MGGTAARAAQPISQVNPAFSLGMAADDKKAGVEKHACKGMTSCKGNGGGSKKEWGKTECEGKGPCGTEGSNPKTGR